MNNKPIIVFDFETISNDPATTEIAQIGAIVINPRRLVLEDTFSSYSQILDETKIQAKALEVNRLTLEQLRQAPHPKFVWKDFTNFVNRFNVSGGSYTAPIGAGFNIKGFDFPILQRYCELYGPVDKNQKQNLFSNFMMIDLMEIVWQWTENSNILPSIRLDKVREFMGLSIDNAHDALQDVTDTALILIKFLKMYRSQFPKIKFKDAFKS